ncbi:expressed unknown protein [Seminavis robusta]|uniref:Uncharacterized protein n=1 Tax=Seminavis robusta TaxID=568900 RepID=A0A9N8H8H1_9STRA|nr:expressed unknown protein [Seminavis robusta]|eukprot:Sro160_g072120.1 n/a (556) ;mRNA; r:40981-42741
MIYPPLLAKDTPTPRHQLLDEAVTCEYQRPSFEQRREEWQSLTVVFQASTHQLFHKKKKDLSSAMGALLSTCTSLASSVRSFLCESYGWLKGCFQMTTTTKDDDETVQDRSLNWNDQEIILGDVWDESSNIQKAYANGETRSIRTTGAAVQTLQVTFTNESPTQELILCWVSNEGELVHFYRLAPNGGSHLETTRSGDAFALFQKSAKADVEEGQPPICNQDTAVAAYRPKATQACEHHLVSIRSQDDTVTTGNLRGSTKKQRIGWTLQVTQKKKPQQSAKPEIIDTRQKIYERRKYGLWTVYCEPGCWDPKEEEKKNSDDDFYPQTPHEAFQADLEALTKRLPEHVRGVLSDSTAIYMNQSHPYAEKIDNPVGCFHPGKLWLQEHQMNPDKCGQVEFYNVHNYCKHRRLWGTGGIILHELCHAYHNLHLPDGYKNQDILECYGAAMKDGLYESVEYHCGVAGCDETTSSFEYKRRTAKHYACTNAMEYFAELSVAFLSSLEEEEGADEKEEEAKSDGDGGGEEYNKWFPHNTTQLKEHDPRAYEMLQKLWGVTK